MDPERYELPRKLDWKKVRRRRYRELELKLEDHVEKEYLHLQSIVDGYNKDCLTVKSWSVIGSVRGA